MVGHGLWVCILCFVALRDRRAAEVGATNICNLTILQGIQDFWASEYEDGYPVDIIQTAICQSPENVYWTTYNYYPAQSDISCLYSIFCNDGFGLVTKFHNRSLSGAFIQEYEATGYLVDPLTEDKRFHIFILEGVTVFYKCNDKGTEGPPEAVIKVARRFSPEVVLRAVSVLKDLGIEIEHQYSLNCNPCYLGCKSEW